MQNDSTPQLFASPPSAIANAIAVLSYLRTADPVQTVHEFADRRELIDSALRDLSNEVFPSPVEAPPLTGEKSIPATMADEGLRYVIDYALQLAVTARRNSHWIECPATAARERKFAAAWEAAAALLLSGNAGTRPGPGEEPAAPTERARPVAPSPTVDPVKIRGSVFSPDELACIACYAMEGVANSPERMDWTPAHRFAVAVSGLSAAAV